MRALPRVLVSVYALAIYGFIFLPVIVLVLFSLQATSFPIPPFTGPSLRWYEVVLADQRLTSGVAEFRPGSAVLVARRRGARLPRRLGVCPLPPAALGPAARAAHAALDRQLSDHRHGHPDPVQRRRHTEVADRRRHRPCGDQPAALLRHHLQPDGRASGQHRARRARPRRAGMEGAVPRQRAGACGRRSSPPSSCR